MKRLFCIILICLICISSVVALDLTTKITEISMHPDFWAGLLPSYVAYKFNFNLLELIPERQTEVSITLSTGIIPRTITQNPLNGDPLWIWRNSTTTTPALNKNTGDTEYPDTEDLIESDYDTMAGGWSLRFGQGFGKSIEKDKDKMNLWVSFDGQWERALNPLLQLDRTGYPFKNSVFGYEVANDIIIPTYALPGTPDLAGDQQMLSMSFNLGFEYNMLNAKTARLHGLDIESKFTWAPLKLGNFFSGKADYIRFWLFANGGYTVFESLNESGFVNWSLVVDDELEIRVLTGSAVPEYAQTMKDTVWGLNPDNMTFFGRNSLKLHYYGQQFLNGLCVPSAYAFLDLGYSGGYVNNTDWRISESFWTGSAGLNLDLQMFEVLHIYYEIGYIFWPGNDEAKRGFSTSSTVKFIVKINF
ncbi:MAG: hypothetical protein PHO44_08510 [Sphaerochaetaceae bacterium]|nr:hypothetical protein [Sphaerochaetaceae bacterium]MDD4396920.1 hypothetical protein [Sphaerochaetaceae bacterium]